MRSFITMALAATAFAARQAPPTEEDVDVPLRDQYYDNATGEGAFVDDWNAESDTDNYQSFDYSVDENWITNAEGWNDDDVV